MRFFFKWTRDHQNLHSGPTRRSSGLLEKAAVAGGLARGEPATRTGGPNAAFAPGDAVVVRKPAENVMVSGGHTRLPAYLARAPGVVVRHHGTHVPPDCNAHGFRHAPAPLYAVAFTAQKLRAPTDHPGDAVVAYLWVSHISLQ